MKPIEIVNVLLDNCEAQQKRESQTPSCQFSWDCYDPNNWNIMVEYLKELKKLLINGETHEQEI